MSIPELVSAVVDDNKIEAEGMFKHAIQKKIGDALDLPVDDRMEGTLATVVACIINGARIVRGHDVKEVKRVVKITEKIISSA